MLDGSPSLLVEIPSRAAPEDRRVVGARHLGRVTGRVQRAWLHPARRTASAGVLEAIAGADLITFGPGWLYSSLIPNLLVDEVGEALRASPATSCWWATE